MYYSVILNNYQLGAKAKSMPLSKLVEKTRIDPNHTKFVFKDLTPNEIQLINKLLGTNKVETY